MLPNKLWYTCNRNCSPSYRDLSCRDNTASNSPAAVYGIRPPRHPPPPRRVPTAARGHHGAAPPRPAPCRTHHTRRRGWPRGSPAAPSPPAPPRGWPTTPWAPPPSDAQREVGGAASHLHRRRARGSGCAPTEGKEMGHRGVRRDRRPHPHPRHRRRPAGGGHHFRAAARLLPSSHPKSAVAAARRLARRRRRRRRAADGRGQLRAAWGGCGGGAGDPRGEHNSALGCLKISRGWPARECLQTAYNSMPPYFCDTTRLGVGRGL